VISFYVGCFGDEAFIFIEGEEGEDDSEDIEWEFFFWFFSADVAIEFVEGEGIISAGLFMFMFMFMFMLCWIVYILGEVVIDGDFFDELDHFICEVKFSEVEASVIVVHFE